MQVREIIEQENLSELGGMQAFDNAYDKVTICIIRSRLVKYTYILFRHRK